MQLKALFTIAFYCMMGVSAQVHSRPLSSAELAAAQTQISPKLIPNFFESLDTQPTQSFAVLNGQGPDIRIVPVTYIGRANEAEKQHCGVFILLGGKPPIYSETLSPEQNNLLECDGVKAIGFMAAPSGQPPRLILQIGASLLVSMGNTERTVDMLVFDWNPASNHYSLNKSLSDRLEKDKRPTSTIAQTKRLIENYERQKPK